MFGVSLILLLAVMGGVIAFLGDKLGSKIGKKRLTLFGLRPKYTSILMTVISGILVAATTMGVLTMASNEARTALFGMQKIQEEIKNLTKEKTDILAELETQNQKVKALDEEIKRTNEEIATAKTEREAAVAQREAAIAQRAQAERQVAELRNRYAEAQRQVAAAEGEKNRIQGEKVQLEGEKSKLQGEISSLEEATKKLRESMIAIREGNVIYRNGEIIFAGVLKAALDDEDNRRQLDTFLAAANGHALNRMGIAEDVQAIWIPEENIAAALKQLKTGRGDYYVRMCASGNVVSGELAPATIEMASNRKIYSNNEVILRQKITVEPNTAQVDIALAAALKDVNREAQRAGVVPDPITGKVGAIQSSELQEISDEISKKGGRVELVAKARGDIMISGPVLLKVEVITRHE